MSGSIKLKHASGNGVIIAAPSSNPAADRTLTLPSDADGVIAKTDASGNLVVTGDLTVDTSTLKVDSSNNRVGVGTTSPDRTIHCHNSSNTTNVRTKFSNGTTGEGASDGFEIGINGSDPAQAVLVNYENSPMAFFTNATERVRVQAGGGISFNGDTAAANALDDYEEGGWTPSVVHGGDSIANDTNNNRYVKIGSMVFLTFQIYTLGNPNGSTLEIGSLPYSIATHREGTGSCMSNNVDYSSGRTMLSVYASAGTAKLRFYASGSDTNWRAIEGNDFGSGAIIGSIAYHTV